MSNQTAKYFISLVKKAVIKLTNLFNEELQEWENFYNFEMPHSALDGQTPYERFRGKAKL